MVYASELSGKLKIAAWMLGKWVWLSVCCWWYCWPTRRVCGGHPWRGSWLGNWHAVRLSVGEVVRAWARYGMVDRLMSRAGRFCSILDEMRGGV